MLHFVGRTESSYLRVYEVCEFGRIQQELQEQHRSSLCLTFICRFFLCDLPNASQ